MSPPLSVFQVATPTQELLQQREAWPRMSLRGEAEEAGASPALAIVNGHPQLNKCVTQEGILWPQVASFGKWSLQLQREFFIFVQREGVDHTPRSLEKQYV